MSFTVNPANIIGETVVVDNLKTNIQATIVEYTTAENKGAGNVGTAKALAATLGPNTVVDPTYDGVAQTSTSTVTATPTYSPTSTGIVNPGTATPTGPGSSHPKGLEPPAAAGLAIGLLVSGLIVGLLLAFFLLRKKYRHQLSSAERRWDAERNDLINSSNDKMVSPTLAYAPDPATERKLTEAQSRIKTLEAERNAASAFGDKLDGKAESELLEAPTFGLSVLNERVNQLAMSLAVSSSGNGHVGAGPFTRDTSETVKSIAAAGPQQARQQFEQAARQLINGTLFERVAQPFCFEANEAGRSSGMLKLAKEVQRSNDQAMYARWRSMTHATLRTTSQRKTNETAVATVQQQLFNSIVELLLWSGMETDVNAAGVVATKVHTRLGEVITMMAKLMTVIREEMSTCDYAVDMIPFPQKHMTNALGLSAKEKGAQASRVILAPKA